MVRHRSPADKMVLPAYGRPAQPTIFTIQLIGRAARFPPADWLPDYSLHIEVGN
jgi:hypothetical protein